MQKSTVFGRSLFLVVLLASLGAGRAEAEGVRFVRGDVNADGTIDIADPIFSLGFQFLGGAAPSCLDAADANDDGQLDITDGINILNFLFLAGPSPAPPTSGEATYDASHCGTDPSDDPLGCASFGPCPIGPQNSRPQADAGPDQTVAVGSTVQLDGTASSDVDGDRLSFHWSFTTRPDGSAASLSDPAVPRPTFVADKVGDSLVQLVVNDGSEDSTADTVVITVQPVNLPPAVNAGSDSAITLPIDTVSLNGSASDDGLPAGTLTIAWSQVSGPGTVTFEPANAAVTTARFSASGAYVLRLTASDGALSASAEVTITVNPAGGNPGLPPDPSTVAPPLRLTEATDFAGATDFLYSGLNPIQTGVAQGTIEPRRASVLRGRVLDGAMAPLAGVAIGILNHPELGQTFSRADGVFDMAVNGGGVLIVTYTKAGFLPVQRTVENIPWGDFAHATDVVMIGLDVNVTAVDLTATVPIQVARGSAITDADGSRQATVFFPQGTQATMVLSDGSTQPLSSLSVRATEYTVGPNGPAAMPAKLPPTSGYTYAVEVSIDEALAADATTVRFTRPVPFYVENFLNFPVGGIAPVGVYDRQKGAWMAQPNGRVIKILGTTGGLADLDVTGDDAADTGAALSDLGIDDAERAQLATLYAAGTSLWRAALSHFSPIDVNWARNPPANAVAPRQNQPTPQKVRRPDRPKRRWGSIIRCESQGLGEEIGVAGTPYQLVYTSERVSGRRYHLDIPVTVGVAPPPSLGRVEVDVTIAGVLFHQVYEPASGLVFTVDWDGRDAYGRFMQGEQPYSVEIRYVYPAVYQEPRDVPQSFALASGVSFGVVAPPGTRPGGEFTFFERYAGTIGGWALPPTDLGGWSLSHQHRYDPRGQVLYLANGEEQRAATIGPVATTLFDTTPNLQSDGAIHLMAVAPDGTIYFVDQFRCRVRMLTPDGTVVPFAGGAGWGVGGCNSSSFEAAHGLDGIPATEASLAVYGMAVGPDGSVYLADVLHQRIRRVGPDGLINTVAGNGLPGPTGDGGPATAAALSLSSTNDGGSTLAVGPDGSIYFSGSADSTRLRQVSPNGIIQTMAGTGVRGSSGDGGPATQATLQIWRGTVAVGPDGSVYLPQINPNPIRLTLRRITPDGVIRRVAGGGPTCAVRPCGDGGPAVQASIEEMFDLTVGPKGSVFFVDRQVIRQIGPEGILNTIAGLRDTNGYPGDGRQATATQLSPNRVSVAPDNSLLVVSSGNSVFNGKVVSGIRRLALPSVLTAAELAVPSQDGREIYVFTRTGRHLRTVHALTNAVLREFAYDADGHLVSVTERTGGLDNVTTIEGAGGNGAIAIVGHFGHRTELTRDAQGYLSGVTNPANETIQLVHDAGGLLTQLIDPRGGVHRFAYDAQGRLTRDEAPDGGAITLSDTVTDKVSTVTLTTAEGRITTYRTELLSNGELRRVITGPSGAQTTILRDVNGVRTTTAPDGTVETVVEGPDPRWGLLAPVTLSQTVRLPSGLTRTVTGERTVTLTNPADLFALATLDETLTVNGRPTTQSFTVSTRTLLTTTPTGRQVTMIVDEQGRVTSRQVAGLDPVVTTYDDCGRVATVNERGGTTTFGYGPDGSLASITDAMGRTATYVRDPVGRIVSQTRPDGTVVGFKYDKNGKLTRLTPPDRPDHAFDYTQLDLTASYEAPGAIVTNYSFNRDSQLTRMTRPDGKLMDLRYDTSGRLSSQIIDTGTIAAVYDTANRLTRLTAPGNNVLALSYDGLLGTSDVATGAVAGNVGRAYDPSFRLTSRSLNGNAIGQTYDADDLLTGAGNLTLARDLENGLVSNTTFGVVTTALARNGFGEIMGMEGAVSNQDFYTTSYERDDLRRITSLTETIDGDTTQDEYSYDANGRLREVHRNSQLTEEYEYDANGNRTRATVAGATVAATYDDQDRLLTDGNATFTHTAAGERLTKTEAALTTTYTYDALGNLVGATLSDGRRITYLIDGRNRRVGKRVDGTMVQEWLYQDQLRPIAELNGAGAIVSRFVYAERINVPDAMIRGGVEYRIVSDHRGSPRLVVNATTGAIVQRMDYDSFGNVVLDTNPGFQPFGFAGGLYDRDTRLVHMGAREYDAETGRWTTKDPVRFAGGDANLYAYVANDPVNLVDPDGLSPLDWEDWDLSGAANFAAGFGDTLTGGLTESIREAMGTNQFVNSDCPGYAWGRGAAYAHMAATAAAGIAAARAGATAAASSGAGNTGFATAAARYEAALPAELQGSVTTVQTASGATAGGAGAEVGSLGGGVFF